MRVAQRVGKRGVATYIGFIAAFLVFLAIIGVYAYFSATLNHGGAPQLPPAVLKGEKRLVITYSGGVATVENNGSVPSEVLGYFRDAFTGNPHFISDVFTVLPGSRVPVPANCVNGCTFITALGNTYSVAPGIPSYGNPSGSCGSLNGQNQCLLTLTVASGTGGNVTVQYGANSATVPRGASATFFVQQGDTVTLTANPANKTFTFTEWTGTYNTQSNPLSFTMSGNTSESAVYNAQSYQLTLTAGTGGSAQATCSGYGCFTPQTVQAGQTQTWSLRPGTTVTLTAQASTGYAFTGWSGTYTSTQGTLTLQMNQNTQETAGFTQVYTLTVSAQTGGSVTVQFPSNTTTIQSGQTQSWNLLSGTQVTLTANPSNGYSFTGWTGTYNTQSNPYTFQLNGNTQETANFLTYTLTVSAQTGGSVTVQFSGNTYTVQAGQTQTWNLAPGTSVALTANPSTGYGFAGWSGTYITQAETFTFTVNQNTQETAEFVQMYTLTVTAQTGGSVTVNIPGGSYTVQGGQTQSYEVPKGGSVTLTANPSSGYNFQSWSGTYPGSSPTLSFTMSQNTQETAEFVQVFTLTVSAQTGGSVTVDIGGSTYTVNPGSSVSWSVNSGTSVTLTAQASTGYQFSGWTGTHTGSSTTLSFTMSQNIQETANFQTQSETLTVSVPHGCATTVSHNGNNYTVLPGQTENFQVAPNTQVTVTAPLSCYHYVYLSGHIYLVKETFMFWYYSGPAGFSINTLANSVTFSMPDGAVYLEPIYYGHIVLRLNTCSVTFDA